jgi:hypothetical protein
MGLLAVGGAVLICGTAWALVGYGEKLAEALAPKNSSNGDRSLTAEEVKTLHVEAVRAIEKYRRFLIFLSGWLSAAGIGTAIVILVVANMLYLKSIDRVDWHFSLPLPHDLDSIELLPPCVSCFLANLGPLNVTYYFAFFIWGLGLYAACRVGYLAFSRTVSAALANVVACRQKLDSIDGHPYSPAPSGLQSRNDPPGNRMRQWEWWATTVVMIAVIAFVTCLARNMTSYTMNRYASDHKDAFHEITSGWVVLHTTLIYLVMRIVYQLRSQKHREKASPPKDTAADGLKDPVRISYNLGRPVAAMFHVVGLAILTICIAAIFTQGDLGCHGLAAVGLPFFTAGLYPIGILVGLGYCLAAADPGSGREKNYALDPSKMQTPWWITLPMAKQLGLGYSLAARSISAEKLKRVEPSEAVSPTDIRFGDLAASLAAVPEWKSWRVIKQLVP